MARDIDARYPDAEALAREVVAWLDGARRREQALDVVARARAMEPEIATLRAQATEKRAESQAKLDGVRPFDPAEKKEAGWALEDEANRLTVAAALREAEWLETLQSALTVDPDLPEATRRWPIITAISSSRRSAPTTRRRRCAPSRGSRSTIAGGTRRCCEAKAR